jgi:predicted ATPase/DNA-binding winged helix-turn-helix (wHTH) protein
MEQSAGQADGGAQPMAGSPAIAFGSFLLVPNQRKLLENGRPVRLGSRAFDILVALAERAGEVVPNADLMRHVWPGTIVEPGALRVHLAGLRKALGDGREGHRLIVNVPSQGYCFVAAVVRSKLADGKGNAAPRPPASEARADSTAAEAATLAPLPAQLTRMIGRDADMAEVLRVLHERRCVTLVGPGGIGKTTLALAAAREAAAAFEDCVVFVEVAPLTDPTLLAGALVTALGLKAGSADPMRDLLPFLIRRRVLIVLDNCEHLIEAAANLAQALLAGAPRVHLLITSREPLRIQGEWVHRLTSLAVPPSVAALTVREAMQVPSVELFVERVRAVLDSFVLADGEVPAVVQICRALDGIPLALELAAAGVERMGLKGVVSQLGNRLALLTRGRRTALPRHQTLRAALDWGYALLSPSEQSMLRRLSIFKGRFTVDAARAVCADANAQGADEDLFNLTSKSFVASDISGEAVQFWLLKTTAEYAGALRDANGEHEELAMRHARYMLVLLQASEHERESMPARQWLALQTSRIDDYRAAIQWALGEGAQASLGVSLAAAAAPLWFALSFTTEYMRMAERALATIQDGQGGDSRHEMALCAAMGSALWHLRGTGPEAEATFKRLMDVATRVGSRADTLNALWGLWMISLACGKYDSGIQVADRFGALVCESRDPVSTVLHHRMLALSHHYMGQHAQARAHARKVLDDPTFDGALARDRGFRIDQRVAALSSMSRALWMLGEFEPSTACAGQAMDRALEIDHALSLCFALALACAPVAFWAGDWDTASRHTELLMERSKSYALDFWHAFGSGFELVLRRHGGSDDGLESLEPSAAWLAIQDLICTFDDRLADAAALSRGATGEGRWCAPELLRQIGERAADGGNLEVARESIQSALELARSQQAKAWELRCATTLARLLQSTQSLQGAHAVLDPVVQRFEGSIDTVDLRRARMLLTELR